MTRQGLLREIRLLESGRHNRTVDHLATVLGEHVAELAKDYRLLLITLVARHGMNKGGPGGSKWTRAASRRTSRAGKPSATTCADT